VQRLRADQGRRSLVAPIQRPSFSYRISKDAIGAEIDLRNVKACSNT
jgi:hypothetical protein